MLQCQYLTANMVFRVKQCLKLTSIKSFARPPKPKNTPYFHGNRKLSTIYALSSGHGKCAVAIIRISGEQARQSIIEMTASEKLPHPRKIVLKTILDPISREVLDKGLVVWFPSPKSFTGEDSVEFHIHGGPAVCKAVLSALGKLPHFTPAEPGDFTKRAFYNSKLDLTSVEGLGDLIHAETEAQRKQAFNQMEGSLRKVYEEWRKIIIKCRANIEAYIDFSEEDNIEGGILVKVREDLEKLAREMFHHLSDSRRGERLRSGLSLVILGRPNVGKSTFLNGVVRRPAAIVSPIAGTTRDVVEVSLDFGGYPVNLKDTAGLRPTQDTIEKEGIRRALGQVEGAHIAIIIVDAMEIIDTLKGSFDFDSFMSNYCYEVGIFSSKTNLSDLSLMSRYEWLNCKNYLIFVNKIDLLSTDDKTFLIENFKQHENVCFASLKTFEGFNVALEKMKKLCESVCGSTSLTESPYLTSQRHRTHIEECLEHLKFILGLSPNDINNNCNLLKDETLLMAAQRLQFASSEIGSIIGQITTEDILDHIFSSFCIGK